MPYAITAIRIGSVVALLALAACQRWTFGGDSDPHLNGGRGAYGGGGRSWIAELGQGDGKDGNPAAFLEIPVSCRKWNGHNCRVEIGITFNKRDPGERIALSFVDSSNGQNLKTVYVQDAIDNNGSFFVISFPCSENAVFRAQIEGGTGNIQSTAQVSINGDGYCTAADETNKQHLAKPQTLYDREGRPLPDPH